MKLLNLAVDDLRRLDRTTHGELQRALQEQVLAGRDPEIVVRRGVGAEVDLSRWTISVVGSDDHPTASFEIIDAHGVSVVAGIWLADLRAEIAADVRLRLDEERGLS
jgi:hypothetical protein